MSPKAGEGRGRPQGLSLCSLGGHGGTGLRKSRCAVARPRRSSRRTYRIVCLRGSVSTMIQIVVYAGAPLGSQKIKSIPSPPPPPPLAALILYISTLSFQLMQTFKRSGLQSSGSLIFCFVLWSGGKWINTFTKCFILPSLLLKSKSYQDNSDSLFLKS